MGEITETVDRVLTERALKGSVDVAKAKLLEPRDVFGRQTRKKVKSAQIWSRYNFELDGGATVELRPSTKAGRFNAKVQTPGSAKDLTFLGKTPKELRKIFGDPAVRVRMKV